MIVFFISVLNSLLVIEGGVGLGDLWVKGVDLLWGGEIVSIDLNESSGVWGVVVVSGPGWWGSVSKISGGLVWSSGLWVGVVVWNVSWLLSGAWSSGWSVHWAVSSRANLSSAVDTIGSIVSVAWWELSWGGLNNNWVPFLLNIVEFVSLHSNVLSEILISVHSSGEELMVWWSAGNTFSISRDAGGGLDESSGRWGMLGIWWLVEVWWGIVEFNSRSTNKEGNNSFHFQD